MRRTITKSLFNLVTLLAFAAITIFSASGQNRSTEANKTTRPALVVRGNELKLRASPRVQPDPGGQSSEQSQGGPSLIQLSGVLNDGAGNPLIGPQDVTFALYAGQSDETPLWLESQTVTADSRGRFVALLGATYPTGLPIELFATRQAQWLGMRAAGESEGPRTFLASVPYALASGSASSNPAGASSSTTRPPDALLPAVAPGPPPRPVITVITPPGSGVESSNDGAGTVTLNLTTSCAAGELLKWNGTAWACAPDASGEGGGGTGVTTVTAGAGLSASPGNPITTTGTLSIAPSGVTNAMLQNNSLTVNAGTGLSGGGPVALGGSVTLNNGGVTALNPAAGGGLAASGSTGNINLGLLTTCADGQLLKWNGSVWGCAADDNGAGGTVTNITAGAGLSASPGNPITGAGTLSIASGGVTNTMLQNNSLTVNAGAGLTGGGAVALGGSVTLNNGGVTALAPVAGGGLAVSGTTGNVNLGLVTSCSTGQLLKWDGSVWGCAADDTGGGGGGGIGGAGTANLLPKFTGSSTLGDSLIADNGVTIGIGAPNLGLAANTRLRVVADGDYQIAGSFATATTDGKAVFGIATATTGNDTFGVLGQTHSDAFGSAGVRGTAVSSTGSSAGVFGSSISSEGIGVFGSGFTGVSGQGNVGVSGVGERGVWGSSVNGYGVFGSVLSPTGYGVYSQGNLHVEGDITHTGTIIQVSSARWKTNISPLTGALNKVQQLRGVSYDWKSTGRHDIGLIAEEVHQVVPEVVSMEANGVDAKGVDYARLTSLLIEAVKEQQAQIRLLQATVDSLKQRLGAESAPTAASEQNKNQQ